MVSHGIIVCGSLSAPVTLAGKYLGSLHRLQFYPSKLQPPGKLAQALNSTLKTQGIFMNTSTT